MADRQLAVYNITGPTVITPPSPLNLITGLLAVTIVTPGTAGNFVANDCASVAQANVSNQLFAIPYNQVGGYVNCPVQKGLVISQVPTGMVLALVYTVYVPSPPKLVRLMAFNISAPGIITPPSPLNTVAGIEGASVLTQGSAGSWVFNDAATLAAASIANQFASCPFDRFPVVDWPVQNGLVISQVPTGAVISVVYNIHVV